MNHFYEDVSNLNAPYDVVPVPGGGLGRALGADDDPQFPWNTYSEQTAKLQNEINAKLKPLGGCPLVVDGALGGGTCGALGWLTDGEVTIATCLNHQNEWRLPNFPKDSGIPCAKASTTPISPEPTQQEIAVKEKFPSWIIGLAIGVAAVGAAYYFRKKK